MRTFRGVRSARRLRADASPRSPERRRTISSTISARPAAASGRARTAARRGIRSSTSRASRRSARSRSIRPTKDVVWVGTGEANPRNDVSYGIGLFKSTDGGKTWTSTSGLKATWQHLAHRGRSERFTHHVVVAAFGDLFKDSANRGVYVTFDGGKTWNKSLYLSAVERRVRPRDGSEESERRLCRHLAVSALAVDLYERRPRRRSLQIDRRRPDVEAADRPRLAGGHHRTHRPCDRTERPNRVYALIEAKDGILWRSDDAGATGR